MERMQKNVKCWYCTEEGHVERDCQLKTKATTLRDTWKSAKEKKKSMQVKEEAAAVYASAQALVSTTSRIANDHEWIVDSGASHHISGYLNLFRNLKRLAKPIQICLADNTVVPATYIGRIRLLLENNTRFLDIEVLYAKQFTGFSLLSVAKLSAVYSVNFDGNECTCKDVRNT